MQVDMSAPSAAEPATSELLRVEGLTVHYPIRSPLFSRERRVVHAVDDVSFEIQPGETLGLVGESGSGKSTTGLAILRRVDITAGRLIFDREDMTDLRGAELRRWRRNAQMIFQDPYASLNPRMRIGQVIAEPLVVHTGARASSSEVQDRVRELLHLVGLPSDAAERYPHACSGGQRQRVAIARALALNPRLVVADEPVSARDVSIQAQVVNLMKELQQMLQVSYLFVSHNLAVVQAIADRIAIMYAGKLVELASVKEIYDRARHPYTKALLSAVPIPDPESERTRRRIVLKGGVPNPSKPPSGCRFHGRCPYAQERCSSEVPALRQLTPTQRVACHFAEEIAAGALQPG
jgi:oligopeptide/dipeptide ABC transporter ATP-binding protein